MGRHRQVWFDDAREQVIFNLIQPILRTDMLACPFFFGASQQDMKSMPSLARFSRHHFFSFDLT
jgi:hypothetical protein